MLLELLWGIKQATGKAVGVASNCMPCLSLYVPSLLLVLVRGTVQGSPCLLAYCCVQLVEDTIRDQQGERSVSMVPDGFLHQPKVLRHTCPSLQALPGWDELPVPCCSPG